MAGQVSAVQPRTTRIPSLGVLSRVMGTERVSFCEPVGTGHFWVLQGVGGHQTRADGRGRERGFGRWEPTRGGFSRWEPWEESETWDCTPCSSRAAGVAQVCSADAPTGPCRMELPVPYVTGLCKDNGPIT